MAFRPSSSYSPYFGLSTLRTVRNAALSARASDGLERLASRGFLWYANGLIPHRKSNRERNIRGMSEPTAEEYYLHDEYDDEEGDEMPMDEDHPMWKSERIQLTSVGIDIGSSTSHLIFSRLLLRRQGIALSSRFVVVKREILHESPILLTPYVDKTTIDTNKLRDFIRESYQKAGVTPKDIDTGAVIVTGEAAKKKNADAIAELFSTEAGKFVCATAGHNLEAILAAYGSGAVHLTMHEGNNY